MYIFDFFKNLFKKQNIGLIIWLVLNTLLIVAIFSSGFQTWQGVLLGLGIYILSLFVALSPIGEWILRLQTGCKKMTDPDDIARFEPIFREVYARAKELNPELHKDVKLFINNSDVPNAFATGRRTVCVTKGLLKYSDEHIKGVLAHEFGHLAHKDTDSILVVSVGNLIVTCIFVAIRVFGNIFMGIAEFLTAVFSEGIGGVIAVLFMRFSRLISNLILALLMRLWTQIGVWLCMSSSRNNEYAADAYACKCGYGRTLAEVLESFGTEKGEKGLFAALSSSHPDNAKRIEKINNYSEY